MFRIVLTIAMLMAGAAHATCLLGTRSDSIPWDATTCPTDPNMPSDNYSVTLTGPVILQQPAHMPSTGDKFITLFVTYAAGGSLGKLGKGFIGEADPCPDGPNVTTCQFGNKPGTYDALVCQIHAIDNPLGQGPDCELRKNLHPIGTVPAPPGPTGGVARGSGTSVTLPLTAAAGSTVICGALTGNTTSMTVSDDTGDKFTGFDASRTNTQHPIQMFKAEKITGSPNNFKLTIPTSDNTLVMRCDTLPSSTVLGSAGFTNQTLAPAGTNAIVSYPLSVSVGDSLYAFALCSCGPLSSIAAGTAPLAYILANPSDLAPGATYPMNAETAIAAAAGNVTAAFTVADKGNNWNVDFIRLGKQGRE